MRLDGEALELDSRVEGWLWPGVTPRGSSSSSVEQERSRPCFLTRCRERCRVSLLVKSARGEAVRRVRAQGVDAITVASECSPHSPELPIGQLALGEAVREGWCSGTAHYLSHINVPPSDCP